MYAVFACRFADAPLEPYSPDKLSLAAACVQQYEAEQRDMRLRVGVPLYTHTHTHTHTGGDAHSDM